MSPEIQIILIGVLAATACALLGCFLVLRKMAMLADAISHAILPGLVLAYFLANGPNLIAGIMGAALFGILTVTLVEALNNSRRVKEDSAIGIVFPAMFAFGTFLVSRYFANVHLDADAVLYGEIAFAPFERLVVSGTDLGPQSLWVMGVLTLLNLGFVTLFYKELKLATFDAGLAASLGFSPVLIHYLLMTMVSLTTVGAFSAVGAILVVALLITPAATAYLLTDRLPVMIGLAVLVGALSAILGYALAIPIDASISGMMATVAGLLFMAALLGSPTQGLIAKLLRRRRQRGQFAAEMLVVHLHQHEGSEAQAAESEVVHLHKELQWDPRYTTLAISTAAESGWVTRSNGHLDLTETGREAATRVLVQTGAVV
jgi:manganese/zinc/iron transport system permease protein